MRNLFLALTILLVLVVAALSQNTRHSFSFDDAASLGVRELVVVAVKAGW